MVVGFWFKRYTINVVNVPRLEGVKNDKNPPPIAMKNYPRLNISKIIGYHIYHFII